MPLAVGNNTSMISLRETREDAATISGLPFDTSATPSAILEKGYRFSLIVSGFHALLFNRAARRRGGGAWLHHSATAGVLLGAPDADFEWPLRPA
jgi:hypothetical protein